jgi:hypothetical protein
LCGLVTAGLEHSDDAILEQAAVFGVARKRTLAQVKLKQQPVILEHSTTDYADIIQYHNATNYSKNCGRM